MKKATTIIALGFAVVLANVATAGNGGNHNNNNHNFHHNNHHKFHHKLHHKFHNHHQHGRHNYGYAAPYFVPSVGFSAPPQRPIVLSPINIVNTAPAPARVEKAPAVPAAKVEMGGTVRVTSDRIEDTGKGRAVLKVGHGYKKLVVVQWTDGLAVVEIPTLHYKTDKPATLMVFNGPGKLASKVAVTVVPADLSAQVDGQFAGQVQ